MSRNPLLNDKAFGTGATAAPMSPAEEWAAAQAPPAAAPGAAMAPDAVMHSRQYQPQAPTATNGRVMTLGGVSAATLFMFAFILIGGAYGWSLVTEGAPQTQADGTSIVPVDFNSGGLLIGAVLVGLALAMVTVFVPKIARLTAIPYALAEGLVLGTISHLYNAQFDGIVVQAVFATFGVFLVMLALYGLRVLRATPKFTKVVVGATFGIMIMYMLSWVMSLFSDSFSPFWNDAGVLGIGISIVIVVVAALNLILDFDFIERGSKNNLPAYMDWYAAFGLVVTLVWLYLEMLRLLAKMRSN